MSSKTNNETREQIEKICISTNDMGSYTYLTTDQLDQLTQLFEEEANKRADEAVKKAIAYLKWLYPVISEILKDWDYGNWSNMGRKITRDFELKETK